ncbi:hypothetical protein EPO44_15560 [bacterium]|nr:MAG: hypothetical protein EPO44_15560 [bacterium]
MDPRTQKRIIIALVYVLLIFSVGAGSRVLYSHFHPYVAPGTCFDGIQNQNETGIDCGGVCSSCASVTQSFLQKIQVHWTKTFEAQAGVYDLAAEIQNPNFTYGSEDVEYHFEILDSTGKQIQSVPGKTFILPQETRSVVMQAVALQAPPAQAVLHVDAVLWQRIIGFSNSGIHVDNRQVQIVQNDPNVFARMSGIVANDSPYDLRSIEVNMVAYNASGDPIAVNRTDIQTVKSGEKRQVEVIVPHPFSGTINRFTIFGYSDFFTIQNFIAQHTTEEKFQQYYQ